MAQPNCSRPPGPRMADRPLHGVGVLVTRPRTQATELVDAIEAQGGTAYCLPVIDIAPLDELDVRAAAKALDKPDFVIFVSRNAVEYGIEYADNGKVAAIGPATARAIEKAGRIVDIRSTAGYDSEHLLAEPPLLDVAGKRVRILRGSAGRELLADELRSRGAKVDYLSVYERRLPAISADTLADLESRWRQHQINVITIMSVQSLANLAKLLPAWCCRPTRVDATGDARRSCVKRGSGPLPGVPADSRTRAGR